MEEVVDPKVKEGPQRARKPMSDEQKQKIRESNRRTTEKKKAAAAAEAAAMADYAGEGGDFLQGAAPQSAERPQAVSSRTGLSEDERVAMELTRKLAEAEARIKSSAVSAPERLMIEKAVRADVFNLHRYHVELTPSMCEVRDCGYDAATDPQVGCAGWDAAPTHQVLDNGKTFGQRLIELKEYHKATQHTVQTVNDHIITKEELHNRQWGIGQDIRGDFLTGSR